MVRPYEDAIDKGLLKRDIFWCFGAVNFWFIAYMTAVTGSSDSIYHQIRATCRACTRKVGCDAQFKMSIYCTEWFLKTQSDLYECIGGWSIASCISFPQRLKRHHIQRPFLNWTINIVFPCMHTNFEESIVS